MTPRAARRLPTWWARGTALAVCAAAAGAAPAQPPAAGLFFDDFSHADAAALVQRGGWRLRDASGHPGVPGARWAPEGLSLVDDPGQPGNRLLRLTASTDGTAAGTRQAQLCHARKLLHGTYAARIRFTDSPRAGAAGDPVVQTFYTVAPLAHDFDPRFSEVDWEYLPNGGWGSPAPRLYGISWQTVRLDPWQAHNSAHEAPGRLGGQGAEGASDGWHLLGMVVTPEAVEMFLDGQRLATHSGRQVPVQPMAMQFNLWFSPGGLGPASAEARVWVQEVDWVFHAAGQRLSMDAVLAQVAAWRAAGVDRVDTVPAAQPPLDSPCSF